MWLGHELWLSHAISTEFWDQLIVRQGPLILLPITLNQTSLLYLCPIFFSSDWIRDGGEGSLWVNRSFKIAIHYNVYYPILYFIQIFNYLTSNPLSQIHLNLLSKAYHYLMFPLSNLSVTPSRGSDNRGSTVFISALIWLSVISSCICPKSNLGQIVYRIPLIFLTKIQEYFFISNNDFLL